VWFLTSGTLTVSVLDTNVDLFLVGGGAKGGDSCYDCVSGYRDKAGSGGHGGYRLTANNQTLASNTQYSIVIGESDATSTLGFGLDSNTGVCSSGGAGIIMNHYEGTVYYGGSSPEPGVYAFADEYFDPNIYGKGGVGGGDWSNGSVCSGPNTGCGGGGGGSRYKSSAAGSDGCTGILIMRSHR